MSQRYFLTTESTYEALRLAVDADLGYPTATADSIFTPALQAPRDSLRRIVLAVDDALPGYSQIITRVTPLLANASAQELTEAEYLAFLTCVETSSGSVDAGSITSGTLDAARLPASVVRTNTASAGPIQVYAVTAFPSPPPADPNDYMLFEGYDGVDMTSNISASGVIACAAITLAGTDLATTLSGKAASSHAHGSITNAGAIGTTSGLIVTTGASGVLGTLAMGTAGQVLKINSGATGVEWGSAAADVSIDTTAADILSATSGAISADDPGADRLVFWDDSAGKLTHLTVGTGLTITDTTITSAGSTSASDLTSGTLAYARMADPTVTSPSQIAANQNNYASFARGINRFTTDAARDITGMAAGNDGEIRVLCNVGTTAANTLTIKDESSSSTAANRFSVPWNGDCVIAAESSVVVFYDGTSSRWRVV